MQRVSFQDFQTLDNSFQNPFSSARGNFSEAYSVFQRMSGSSTWAYLGITVWSVDPEAEESASHPTLLPCLSKGGAARRRVLFFV